SFCVILLAAPNRRYPDMGVNWWVVLGSLPRPATARPRQRLDLHHLDGSSRRLAIGPAFHFEEFDRTGEDDPRLPRRQRVTPYASTMSSGSTTSKRDFDIF